MCVCVCVCVCEREREREIVSECVRARACEHERVNTKSYNVQAGQQSRKVRYPHYPLHPTPPPTTAFISSIHAGSDAN